MLILADPRFTTWPYDKRSIIVKKIDSFNMYCMPIRISYGTVVGDFESEAKTRQNF